jgi:hypothetical protein
MFLPYTWAFTFLSHTIYNKNNHATLLCNPDKCNPDHNEENHT